MRLVASRVPVPAAGFAVTFVLVFIAAALQGAKPFVFDAAYYWGLSETFERDGRFSLLNFSDPLRGYLFALGNHGLQSGGSALGASDSLTVKVFNSAMFALLTGVLAPALAERTWPRQRWGLGRRLALTAFVLIFWHGYLNFPLTDFAALNAVLLALVAAGHRSSGAWMLVAGLSVGAAINLRPAFLVLLPVIILLIAYSWFRDEPGVARRVWALRGVGISLFIVGFTAVTLPQSLIAHRHHDTFSFVPGSTAGLSTLQFTEGTRVQRYDTYVGPGRPSPRMVYTDPTGSKILRQRTDKSIDGAGDYAQVILDHPIAMTGIVARHVVNGLDARYATPYIERIDDGRNRWMRLSGFLLVFLALTRIAWPAARRTMGPARWRYPAALLLSGASSLASAVETRFLLPAYLLSYVLVLGAPWPNPLRSRHTDLRRFRLPAILALSLVGFFAVVLSIVGAATGNLRFE